MCTLQFAGSGAAQWKEETILPKDPVTITVVRTNARTTFRYWQLFLHQILTTLQSGVAFFIFVGRYDQFFHVTSILCYVVLGLSVVSLVLTYLYSTDTFILVHLLLVTFCLHRRYPHQVKQVN